MPGSDNLRNKFIVTGWLSGLTMAPERITSYSPLRVSFSGGGTDISPFIEDYGSALINTTIDRGVTVKYRSDSNPIEVSSRDFLRTSVHGSSRARKGLSDLIVRFLEQKGVKKGRMIINSDVPPGSGLGSSSALITAIMAIVETLEGNKIVPEVLAESSYRWEKDFFGITLGKQDPYAISLGDFKYMEMNGHENKVIHFRENKEFLKSIEENSLLVYTGKTRESSQVLKDQVLKSSKGDDSTIENLKKLKKMSSDMKKAILSEDMKSFADLINYGWSIKRQLSVSVSNKRVDDIIRKALTSGALAARLLGGGSQGFIYVLADSGNLYHVQKEMLKLSKFAIRFSFDPLGTRIIQTEK